ASGEAIGPQPVNTAHFQVISHVDREVVIVALFAVVLITLMITAITTMVRRLPWLRATRLRATLYGGEHRCCAVLVDEATGFSCSERTPAHFVLREAAARHQLEQVEGGTVERFVAAAVLSHGGERGAFVLERGAVVDRVAVGALRRRGWCADLAVRLAVGLAANLDPAGALHDLACLGDKAMCQWFVN